MPWELLGHTQFRHLTIVQIADLGGVYAVSFVMALASVAGAELLREGRATGRARPWRARLALPAAVLLATCAYGAYARRLYAASPEGDAGRTVAVVQGNIPNAFRWKQAFFERMLATYAGLSGAARGERPDVIVWPENAANFYLNREPLLLAELAPTAALAREGLVVGGPRLTDGGEARNAAYLIGPSGTIIGTYDKQHLVPLAEYDPRRGPGAGRAWASGRARPSMCAGESAGSRRPASSSRWRSCSTGGGARDEPQAASWRRRGGSAGSGRPAAGRHRQHRAVGRHDLPGLLRDV